MKDCMFCKIVNKEVDTELIYEDDEIIAFNDINPSAPIHILVIPKEHIPRIGKMSDEELDMPGKIIKVARKIADQKDLTKEDAGFRLQFNSGKKAGMEIEHLHLHLKGWQ